MFRLRVGAVRGLIAWHGMAPLYDVVTDYDRAIKEALEHPISSFQLRALGINSSLKTV